MLSRRRWLNVGALCAALALVVGTFALADVLRYPAAPTHIDITATAITSAGGSVIELVVAAIGIMLLR